MMLNFIKKKTGPDFSKLENNDVNLSSIKLHFSLPTNGSKKWGIRKTVPKHINLYDDNMYKDVEFNAKQDLSLAYIRRTWLPITTQIWDYLGYFWQGMAGDFGNLTVSLEIIKPKHYNETIASLPKLKQFLMSYYSELYEGPDGWNTQRRQEQLETDGNLDGFDNFLEQIPTDFETTVINSTEWLTYTKQSYKGEINDFFYTLPLSVNHYLSVNFNYTTTNDMDGSIKASQLKATEKIASYIKVSFPDET